MSCSDYVIKQKNISQKKSLKCYDKGKRYTTFCSDVQKLYSKKIYEVNKTSMFKKSFSKNIMDKRTINFVIDLATFFSDQIFSIWRNEINQMNNLQSIWNKIDRNIDKLL